MRNVVWGACLIGAVAISTAASTTRLSVAPPLGRGTILHAHNCYPEHGRYHDRLTRALGTGLRPIAIEQDLVWVPATPSSPGRSVVSHGQPLTGLEPTLEEHFFRGVQPIIEHALAENRRDQWPVIILHLDFKTNEPQHHRGVWELLGRYERWLTTAERVSDAAPATPLTMGPLLVLTENGDGQVAAFHNEVPIGQRLRLFGMVPSAFREIPDEDRDAHAARLAAAPVAELIPGPPTNYRRWTNHSWATIEQGGQQNAGDWTTEENQRLRLLVERAHAMKLWLRLYALNGHEPNDQGWSASYNFGSLARVEPRWRAAVAAGVDLLATDQYEQLGEVLRRR